MAVGPPQWIYFTCVIFFESGREDVFDDAVFIAGLLVCLCINLWMRLMGMCGTDFEERCEMLKCVLVNKHVGREWRGPSGRCSITVWLIRSQKKKNVEFESDFTGCDALNTTVRLPPFQNTSIWSPFFFLPSWKSSSVHAHSDSDDHGGPWCRRSSRSPTFIWRRGRSTTPVSCSSAISLARWKASWLWWLSILSRAFVVCSQVARFFYSCRFLW